MEQNKIKETNKMRLQDFIMEQNKKDDETLEGLKQVEKKCQPFLNDLKRIGNPKGLFLSGRTSNKS
jgi:hypothetical protein